MKNEGKKDYFAVIKEAFILIPGAVMNVPLLAGMLMYTFSPAALKSGSLTTALFQDSSLPLLGLLFFLAGTQLQLSANVKLWIDGLILIFYKLAVGLFVYIIVLVLFGYKGAGGVTPLSLLISLTQPNLAMYMAITLQLGSKGHLSLLPLLSVLLTPFILSFTLNIDSSVQEFLLQYISLITPFVLGAIVGSLFSQNKSILYRVIPWIIPFFAFSVGAHFHLSVFLQAGFSAIIIAVVVLASGTGAFFLLKQFGAGENATAGIAAGSTASASLVFLQLVAATDGRHGNLISAITKQLIVVIVLTCIFSPILAKFLQRFQEDNARYAGSKQHKKK